MKHLDSIHQAMDTHISKSMKLMEDANKSFETHVGKSAEVSEAVQALASENMNFMMSSIQQAAEATQSMMSAMSSGSFPAVLDIQKSFMTYQRDALNEHMSRMGQAMTSMAQDATASFQGAFKPHTDK